MLKIWDIQSLALEKAVQGSELRQGVLANNVANAGTPGFKRSDVDFHSQLARLVEQGDQGQLDGFQASALVESNTSQRLDGNNVDIDREMTSLAQNQIEHAALTSLLRERIAMLRYAISEGKR